VARSRFRFWLLLIGLPVLLVGGAALLLAWRQGVPAVGAELTPALRFIGVRTPLALVLRAHGGQVASAEVRLVQGQARVVLARQDFGGTVEQRLALTVEGGKLGLREGAATLEVFARDTYWRPLRVDDRPVLRVPVTLDLTPPALEVLSATRYLAQGGGGLVVFRARGASQSRLTVGGQPQPAFPVGDGGVMAALIALPWDAPTSAPVAVTVEDEAGNAVTRTLPVEIRPRRFPGGTVELSPAFLARKLPELLPGRGAIPTEAMAEAFLSVNRDQRRTAEDTKRRLASRTQPRPLWSGAFLQPRNTKVFSNFAETRVYRFQGRDLDTGVHLGYDLASVRQAPVPAANAGTVVWAAPLTIYGNTIVVDHGLGLQTLYAHLSALDVKEGDQVERGQVLGRTGSTGLALGDHLHYEVLIHGVSVTPLEWWDARWIRDHIGRPLREAGVPLLEADQPPAEAEERPAAPARRPRRSRS
jgi:murein DD-endopeptidase MepM/ murein hydrolase activator NlpD